MLTHLRTLILLLSVVLLAGVSHADDFMLGGAVSGGLALAQSSPDCDVPSTGNASVIYHDGQSAPVSVPLDALGAVSDGIGSVAGSDTADSSGAPVTLPSAEAAIPQKPRGGGLRWQSVLPGSIK